jgi:hypothetical protein
MSGPLDPSVSADPSAGEALMRGRCLCGAVRFEAEPAEKASHACHCGMCRRWTGGQMLAVPVAPGDLHLEGEDAIRIFRSSAWLERAWCGRCGSALFTRVVAEGPLLGHLYVALGAFDEPDALPLGSEVHVEAQPAAYRFAGARPRLTGAEFEALLEGRVA